MRVHQTTSYPDSLYNFLKQIESSPTSTLTGDLLPYLDSATPQNVTIGIGFNIQGPSQDGLLRAVLRQFGLDPLDASLSDTQRVAEQGWYARIGNAIQASYGDDTGLRNALDQIMYNRSIDPALSSLPASKKRRSLPSTTVPKCAPLSTKSFLRMKQH